MTSEAVAPRTRVPTSSPAGVLDVRNSPVQVEGDAALIGTIGRVQVTAAGANSLFGSLAGTPRAETRLESVR